MSTKTEKEFSAKELSEVVKGTLIGSHSVIIRGVAPLGTASEFDLSFLANKQYIPQVQSSKAGVVLVPEDYPHLPPSNRAWIKCKDPSADFSVITAYFVPQQIQPDRGIDQRAIISDTATLGKSIHVGPYAVIGKGVILGDHSIIESGAYIGHFVEIGDNCRIYPHVTILDRCKLGSNVIIHSGTVIGSDGFGYINHADGHQKIPQLGIVQIDDDVEIGANVTIDRARFDKTWIKKGVKIDNLVQIAHNVTIGEATLVVSQTGVSGSVTIGKQVILAGQTGIPGHVTIGDGAIIMAKSGLLGDAEPGAKLMGIPTVPRKQFWKQTACMQKLPDMAKKIRELEKEVERLKQQIPFPG